MPRAAVVVMAVAIFAMAVAACSHPATPRPARRLGDTMLEVGMRFEWAGRAVLAGRWDLARYDVDELGEVFEDDVGRRHAFAPLARAFVEGAVPALRTAVEAHDRLAFERAIADAAQSCNACHRAAAKPFIEISADLGERAPVIVRATVRD